MTESAVDNLRVMLASACAFALLFSAADKLSYRYVKVYRDFSRAEQADWSSRYASAGRGGRSALSSHVRVSVRRVNSSVHAVGIVFGLLYTLRHQRWDDDLLPLNSTATATTLFSICTCAICGVAASAVPAALTRRWHVLQHAATSRSICTCWFAGKCRCGESSSSTTSSPCTFPRLYCADITNDGH
jgi:hypothetical protein